MQPCGNRRGKTQYLVKLLSGHRLLDADAGVQRRLLQTNINRKLQGKAGQETELVTEKKRWGSDKDPRQLKTNRLHLWNLDT